MFATHSWTRLSIFLLPMSLALVHCRGCSFLLNLGTLPFLSRNWISIQGLVSSRHKLFCTRRCFFLHAKRVWTLCNSPSVRRFNRSISSNSSQLCSAGLKCLFFILDLENEWTHDQVPVKDMPVA